MLSIQKSSKLLKLKFRVNKKLSKPLNLGME